ncbi:AAA family ATPase [Cystobacter fuscus]|nr:AAA family ATPase [Cystobacter fuscus]
MLHIERLRLENFRCFEALNVAFEPDTTVIFAENGGGKTALLTGLAMAVALLQPRHSKELSLDAERDARRVRVSSDRREPVGPCTVSCTATIGDRPTVEWSVTASPTSGRRTVRTRDAHDAIEHVRRPGERWPIIGYYGTGRLSGTHKPRSKARAFQDRWDGYAGCLDPSATDGPLVEWLESEVLGDLSRLRREEPERRLDLAVLNAVKRASRDIADIWFDPAIRLPMVRFQKGHEATWSELSDGFHVFIGLVGDIARRAVILNSQDGAQAPLLAEGVVLIDEIDLHLHPRWQRVVLKGLRAAFPKLQFIVTTHSPQVLSSAENQQVRRLANWTVQESTVFVEGRDSNAILRDWFGTDDRDEQGRNPLQELHAAIDEGRLEEARQQLAALQGRWGTMDPALIRAARLLDEEV